MKFFFNQFLLVMSQIRILMSSKLVLNVLRHQDACAAAVQKERERWYVRECIMSGIEISCAWKHVMSHVGMSLATQDNSSDYT